jgi:PadR family transcriptional regulator, regulatory protein PadR
MKLSRSLSPQARVILAALLEARETWSHGYELVRLANVKSGTLDPLLIRLEEQGYLEAEWQQPQASGRPPRHAYRLTASGVHLARANPPCQTATPASLQRGAAI